MQPLLVPEEQCDAQGGEDGPGDDCGEGARYDRAASRLKRCVPEAEKSDRQQGSRQDDDAGVARQGAVVRHGRERAGAGYQT